MTDGDERFAYDSYRRLLQMFGAHGARHRGERLRRGPRRAQGGQADVENDVELEVDDLRGTGRHVQEDHRGPLRLAVPAGPARADGHGGARRLRLVEHRARGALPAPGADPRRPGHRRQHLSAWCSATAATTPGPVSHSPGTPRRGRRASTATTCRTRRARTSWPASATPSRSPISRRSTRRRTTSCSASCRQLEEHYRDLCDIEFTIERGQALDAADPGREAHRRRRRSGSPASSSTRT